MTYGLEMVHVCSPSMPTGAAVMLSLDTLTINKKGCSDYPNCDSVLPSGVDFDTEMTLLVKRCRRSMMSFRASQGGYAIIPVYCFGVSRTHDLLPGVGHRYIRLLSRKVTRETQ